MTFLSPIPILRMFDKAEGDRMLCRLLGLQGGLAASLDAYHALGSRFYRLGIESLPWSMREMKITDPFYSRVIFYAPTGKD